MNYVVIINFNSHLSSILACPEGFEPPTDGLEGRCAIQLCHGQI